MAGQETKNCTRYKYQLICNGCGYSFTSDDLNSVAIQLCPNCGHKFKVEVISAPAPKYSKNNPYPQK